MTIKVESGSGGRHHRQIHETGNRHGKRDIPFCRGIAFLTGATVQMLCQGGVQVNHMRHNGRPEDASCQEYRFRGGQTWDHHPFTQLHQIRLGEDQLHNIGCSNKQQQTADDFFQRLLSSALQHQNKESRNPGQHSPLQQRHAEDQFKSNRSPNEFGKVGCHGDNFSLDPVQPNRRTRVVVADLLGQVFARGNAELR